MNSLDIYYIKDINKIIKYYKNQIDKIYKLEQDLQNYKITIKLKTNFFNVIYLKIDYYNFFIMINDRVFTNIDYFLMYFHTLKKNHKINLYYTIIKCLIRKYKKLDFNIQYNYENFNNIIYNFLFKDYNSHSIKTSLEFNYIKLYREYMNNFDNNEIINRLEYNSHLITKSKNEILHRL